MWQTLVANTGPPEHANDTSTCMHEIVVIVINISPFVFHGLPIDLGLRDNGIRITGLFSLDKAFLCSVGDACH